MNDSVKKLYEISQKKSRIILGLMSGTSLDGLDIALCSIYNSGWETKIDLLHFITVPYEATYKNELLSICFKENIEAEKFCLLNKHIGSFHALLINQVLENWNIKANEIDLIASHGQTLFHSPQTKNQQEQYGNSTFQMGDGDQMAVKTGIITISDFRQKHIASGGEGAPLAAYGDLLLFADDTSNRILLNIGGISNCTYLPAGKNIEEIVSSDLGPGNTLMDAWCRKYCHGISYDKDAALAKKGKVNNLLLQHLLSHPFFKTPFPKSTGPENFNLKWIEDCKQKLSLSELSNEDMLSTLNAFTSQTIIEGLEKIINEKKGVQIFVSGGGVHNPLLMDQLTNGLSQHHINSTNILNIPPDAKEAVLFALLANETVAGNYKNLGKGSENFPMVSMGKISFPD